MDEKAVLQEAGGYIGYHILNILEASNIEIAGGRIIGDDSKLAGVDEGHGICLSHATNISIHDVEISKCNGDGIYMGCYEANYENSSEGATSGVKISNCYVHGNHRNNITFAYASDVTIDTCKVVDAKTNDPMCCLEVENNNPLHVCRNLTINNCLLSNKEAGFSFGSSSIGGRLHADNVTFNDCIFLGDFVNYSASNLTVKGCRIEGQYIESGYRINVVD
jgi:hypothetical protein